MGILSMLASDNYIVVNKNLIKKIGLEAAVILGELASEYAYWEDREGLIDGFFYSTVENIEDKTGLSSHNQRQAINKLAELGLVEVKKMGIPAKRYIRICEQQVIDIFNNKSLKILTTGGSKIEQQDVKKLNINNNINNNKKEKENIKKERKKENNTFDDILNSYPVIVNYPELRQTFVDFIKMRKLIKKPLTDRALRGIIKDTITYGNDEPEKMILILEQSIKGSWQGVYALKEERSQVRSNTRYDNPFAQMLEKEVWND